MQANLETGSGRSVAELVYHAQIGTWRPNGDLLLYLARGDNYELRAEDGGLRKLAADEGCVGRNFSPAAIVSYMQPRIRHCRAIAPWWRITGAGSRRLSWRRIHAFSTRRRGGPANPDICCSFAAAAC